MNEFYTEHLIKQKPTAKTMAMKALYIVLCVLAVLAMFVIPFGYIITVIVIFVVATFFKRLNLEFEYLFINGDLDIDKIMGQERRKRVFSTNVKEIEIMAPISYAELKPYENLKKLDCSSATDNKNVFGLVASYKGEKLFVIFEPNETIINGMKYLAPRKVLI